MLQTRLTLVALILFLVVAGSGCGAAPATPTSVPAAAGASAPASGAAALTISGAVATPTTWSVADLRAIGMVIVEMNHPKKGKQTYEGVRLNELLGLAKLNAAAKTLTLSAKDGYQIDVPLADVKACADCLLAIDSAGALSLAMANLESGAWVRDLTRIEVK